MSMRSGSAACAIVVTTPFDVQANTESAIHREKEFIAFVL
jgi:hypothetical protein